MNKKHDVEIKLSGAPNKKYEIFFDKFKEVDTLKVSSWNVTHLLGYFCKKYKEYYQKDYQFKFNSPLPSKCFEVFQIKKLAMQLTADPTLLKEYIDWVYLNKVTKAKRKLTSISFMTVDSLVNEYKFNILLSDKKVNVGRSVLLPDTYRLIFSNTGLNINTYGDLAFASQIVDTSPDLIHAFCEIEKIGFDKSILEKIV